MEIYLVSLLPPSVPKSLIVLPRTNQKVINAQLYLVLLFIAQYSVSTDCHEETEFRCEDGDVCVDRIGVCDVIMDCPDRSDEENCREFYLLF